MAASSYKWFVSSASIQAARNLMTVNEFFRIKKSAFSAICPFYQLGNDARDRFVIKRGSNGKGESPIVIEKRKMVLSLL